MDTPSQLVKLLRRKIDLFPPQLQAAAKYIIDHPADFGIDPIRVTAEKIGVSSNVLVRLAQRLGFDSFDAFRQPFRQALVTDKEDSLQQDWLARMKSADQLSQTQAALAQNELNVVTRSLRLMDPKKIKQATEIILGARRCFVTATRASHALAYYFHYAGRMAHPDLHLIPRHMGSAIDDLLDADENDCLFAITVHPHSADTIRSMRFARDKGMQIVLISDSDVIAPGIRPDVAFQISARSMHHFTSFSGAMAVLECLLGHLFAAGGDDARQRVEDYEKAREDTNAYWQPSKLPKLRRP
ncbi:MurR/RpiR family transcriptional regulator [Ruegeria sp. EL01]|jgi:DNA-binding MurR/RpiR family transcriptional regulator|uniref:MurR/RpiR family transcriptional regulator n=1 Tax=Ruegeria sp. EL01 TaxID=2107578 RepID=UPI000EA7F53F|nr:MurR/RpiR family transcriptional regulator [Ruegeria sp. EL01]